MSTKKSKKSKETFEKVEMTVLTNETSEYTYQLGPQSLIGDTFYGSVYCVEKNLTEKALWTIVSKIISNDNIQWILQKEGTTKPTTPVNQTDITVIDLTKELEEKQRKRKEDNITDDQKFVLNALEPEEKLEKIIEAGLKNIWMVGPAGCGKSTIARNLAKKLNVPYLCVSCGVGTSAVEFVGYKYPEREATKFSEFYAKPSVILIDEITALDPSVGQVLNSALANDEIETTTGSVTRHKNCVIIATSNSFGTGASREYVANNQLDASTIDRFAGGVIEVDYSEKFESQYDKDVYEYIKQLRVITKKTNLRRVVSTRLLQAGHMLKTIGATDWKHTLIENWTLEEKKIVCQHTQALNDLYNKSLKQAA
jgi:ATP-dependent Clp protease ATP-binding subunit ClpA